MITPQHSQMLVHALSMAAQVAGQRLTAETSRKEMEVSMHRLERECDLFELKAGLLRDLAAALIEKRLDAVKTGFTEVLGLYAEQARHYMAQQTKISDAELVTTDPLQSARFRKRMGEIDIELRSIRLAASQLYSEMNAVVMRLGGDALNLSPDYCAALALTMPRGSA